MQIQGALIREQGLSFAVVIVKPQAINNRSQAEQMIRGAAPIFGGVPVVLMAQDGRGRPTYYGRKDISKFMSTVPMHAIPWKKYTIQ